MTTHHLDHAARPPARAQPGDDVRRARLRLAAGHGRRRPGPLPRPGASYIARGILERPGGFSGSIQDLGPVKTMFHIDPNLYLVLNRHSLMLVYLKIS